MSREFEDTNRPVSHAEVAEGGADTAADESHVDTGGATAAGAVTGAVIGTAAGGPLGAVVGAVGGGIVGAISERVMHGGKSHEHVDGDEAHSAGDHEHRGDDDGHDHESHFDLGYGGSVAPHPHRYENGRCVICGTSSATPVADPLLMIPPGT